MILPFDNDQLLKVTIDYDKKPYGKDSESLKDYLEIENENTLLEFYNKIKSFPYREQQEKTIDYEKYWIRIQVVLFYNDDEGIDEYTLTYYSYGVTDGYFVLDNNEIHYVPGDFATAIYERIKVE